MDREVGAQIETKLLEYFTPSFFTQNLYKKNSLAGRISSNLFLICKKLRLNKISQRFNQNTKLCSIVLKAECCWLSRLLDDYEAVRLTKMRQKNLLLLNILLM